MASHKARVRPVSGHTQGKDNALNVVLPEDIICHITSYLGAKDLATVSQVCRELYFASHLVARKHFQRAFGAQPDVTLPRMKLFHLVDRIPDRSEANMRDLMLWSAVRGYNKMIKTLIARAPASMRIIETKQPGTGATPLILATEANRVAAVKLLMQDVSQHTSPAHCHGPACPAAGAAVRQHTTCAHCSVRLGRAVSCTCTCTCASCFAASCLLPVLATCF